VQEEDDEQGQQHEAPRRVDVVVQREQQGDRLDHPQHKLERAVQPRGERHIHELRLLAVIGRVAEKHEHVAVVHQPQRVVDPQRRRDGHPG